MIFTNTFNGKTVLVTGHTGFKGSWLCEWLLLVGANVVGYALEPPTEPSHFVQLDLGKHLTADLRGDVRDLDKLQSTIRETKPDFIFHLAARPIVRLAFVEPFDTITSNIVGTLNVLEAVRREKHQCILIMITTDKCYENREWLYSYREDDILGGQDPYSASKACAEILISAYRRSYFTDPMTTPPQPTTPVASVRAGNVIGGGDWARYRIVPDSVRNLENGKPIPVRNKTSSRPWQHVLEPLSGYLLLAAEIFRCIHSTDKSDSRRLCDLCSAFNFGPNLSSNKTVADVVQEILKHWRGEWLDQPDPHAPYEAGKLHLSTDKSFHILGWQPHWEFPKAIEETIGWYSQTSQRKADHDFVRQLTRSQIRSYGEGLRYKYDY